MAMLAIKEGRVYVDTDDIDYVKDNDPNGLRLDIWLETGYYTSYVADSKEEKQSLLRRFPESEDDE